MSIVTKSQAKAFFETGDTPTQAQFADFIDSIVFTPTAAVSGDRVVVVEGTASSTVQRIGAVGRALVSARTTANALDTLGVGAAIQAALGAATTASAQSQLGGEAVGRTVFEQGTTASAQTVQGGGAVGRTVFEAATTASAQTVQGGGAAGRGVFEQATTASAQTVQGGGTVGRTIFEAGTTASAQTVMGGGAAGRAIFEAITTASADSLFPAGVAANITFSRMASVAAVGSIQVSGMVTGNDYWISGDGVQPGTDDTNLCLRVLRAGATAAASADYRYRSSLNFDLDEGQFVFTGRGAATTGLSNNAKEACDFEIMVPNPMAAVSHNITARYGYIASSASDVANGTSFGQYTSAAAVSALEIFPLSGNFLAVGQIAIRVRARS